MKFIQTLASIGVVAAFFCLPSRADAGGFALPEQSAIAGGTAGAGTARAGDPAAAWYIPAATADGDGWHASVGMLGVAPQVNARGADPDGGNAWRSRSEPALKTPPHLYVSWARRDLALGASVNVPFGSGVAWPAQWAGRYEIVESSLQVVRMAPYAAWRFGAVRVAAGPHVDLAQMHVARRLDMVDDEGRVDVAMSGTGVGGGASLYWEPSETFAVGVSYRSRTRIAVTGRADFEVPDAFAWKASDQRARSGITTPDVLTTGIAFRPSPRWTLVADASLTDWSVYDEVVIDFENEQTTDVRSTPRWEPRPSFRAGAERHGRKVTLRGGALLDPSPAADRNLTPSSPDSHRVGVTLGAGLPVSRGVRIDGFYEYLHLLDRKTANPDSLQASYSAHAHMIGISISRR